MTSKDDLQSFYANTDYWPAKKRPRRPSELNLARATRDALHLDDTPPSNGRIELSLEGDELVAVRPILLHEALFHFYKGFYNYIAARNLMEGGLLHWLNITTYYAKFYLARSVTTLLGKQSYQLHERSPHFNEELARRLHENAQSYRMRLDLDLPGACGTLQFDRKPVRAHRDVWEDYRSLPKSLELTFFVFPEPLLNDDRPWGIPRDHLTRDRNEENYSFDGYFQLDFNLALPQFKQYFERDYLKEQAAILFDWHTSEVLKALSVLWHTFRDLSVEHLPVEREKLEHVVNYSMSEGEAKTKLLGLLQSGFEVFELSSYDGDTFFDQENRSL